MPGDMSAGRRNGHARFRQELLGELIKANQRPGVVGGPLIDLQHILHRRYERRVLLGRDTPAFLPPGFERTFLKPVPPCCERCFRPFDLHEMAG